MCYIYKGMDNNESREAITDKDSRTRLLIGEAGLQKLRRAHILLLGLGGVGSYVCEALARAGIGRLSLVDSDKVEVTNLNRQLYALESTLGMYKTDAAKARCLDIDPHIEIRTLRDFIRAEDMDGLFSWATEAGPIDYVVDAIDTVSAKIALAVYCSGHDIPLVSCCGTGNKLHPELLRMADIYDTSVCPLCRVMRKELKARGIKGLRVCYSTEEPKKTGTRAPASISFVPSAAGLLIASDVINSLINKA